MMENQGQNVLEKSFALQTSNPHRVEGIPEIFHVENDNGDEVCNDSNASNDAKDNAVQPDVQLGQGFCNCLGL